MDGSAVAEEQFLYVQQSPKFTPLGGEDMNVEDVTPLQLTKSFVPH
jgi:hypothetical protein